MKTFAGGNLMNENDAAPYGAGYRLTKDIRLMFVSNYLVVRQEITVLISGGCFETSQTPERSPRVFESCRLTIIRHGSIQSFLVDELDHRQMICQRTSSHKPSRTI